MVAGRQEFRAKLKAGDRPQFALVFAAAQHASRSAVEACRIWSEGAHVLAAPASRLAWECGITAQWLVANTLAAQAMINEHGRLRDALRLDVDQSRLFNGRGSEISGTELDKLATDVRDEGRHFHARCLSFEEGRDLYVFYRLMSGYCHAGTELFDQYLQPPAETLTLRIDPRDDEDGQAFFPFLAVAAAMWAARSLDYFDPDRSHRSRLRKIATALGCAQYLKQAAQVDIRKPASDRAGQSRRR